jgi:inner membrane protein
MDNIAHTLAGLALAEAGLKRRTALGTATLAIGANLPDIDALVYVFGSGTDALVARRGWTHGILAMALLPFALAGLVLLWDRLVRRRRNPALPPADFRALVLLSAIGILSHPLLDLLNTYGVRLLMPFSGRWFYGDTLFIVDPWLWLSLAVGITWSRLRARRAAGDAAASARAARPARLAISLFVAYAAVMAASSRIGREVVRPRLAASDERARASARVMVAPAPATPFRRAVVSDLGGRYELGALTWSPAPVYAPRSVIPSGHEVPGAAEAARTREGAKFLVWSRFPRYTSERAGDSVRVRISDLRYADERGRGWASVVVTVPAREPMEYAPAEAR